MRILLLLILSAGCGLAQIMAGVISAGGNAPTQVATPTFSPTSGSACAGSCSITVNDTDSGLSGYAATYCTNASTDCTPGTSYSGAVTFSATGTHLCAFANASGRTQSVTHCETYTVASSPAIVQKVTLTSQGTSWAPTISATSSTSNWIVIQIRYDNNGAVPITCTDSLTTTYSPSAASANGDFRWVATFTGKPSGAITGVTCTWASGGGSQTAYGIVYEVSGLVSSSIVDKSILGANAGDANWASGSTGALSQASEIGLGFTGCTGDADTLTLTSSGSWTASIPGTYNATGFNASAYAAYTIVNATTALNFQGTLVPSVQFCKSTFVTLKGL